MKRNNDLTDRQLQVARLAGQGIPNKLIARQLNISENTVERHLVEVYRKLDVMNRTEAGQKLGSR